MRYMMQPRIHGQSEASWAPLWALLAAILLTCAQGERRIFVFHPSFTPEVSSHSKTASKKPKGGNSGEELKIRKICNTTLANNAFTL